jgi:hypothetical protein
MVEEAIHFKQSKVHTMMYEGAFKTHERHKESLFAGMVYYQQV